MSKRRKKEEERRQKKIIYKMLKYKKYHLYRGKPFFLPDFRNFKISVVLEMRKKKKKERKEERKEKKAKEKRGGKNERQK